MPQIERMTLEKALSLRHAKAVVDSFCSDRSTYSDEDVYLKRGVCKVLAEEYCPLVRLAEEYSCVRSVLLLPKANPGPDGEIRFWWRRSSKVQVTCANEGYNRALLREQFVQGEDMVFQHQSRYRDKASGLVVSTGRALSTPAADVQSRIERILQAIEAKERNHYPGTDTLLVQDDPANFRHLKESGLHRKVCEAVRKGRRSRYKRIYVNYGDDLKRIK
ncbi:MAG: hypothetical protein AB1646_25325 [Thermodesulfobacteriota bacterium]